MIRKIVRKFHEFRFDYFSNRAWRLICKRCETDTIFRFRYYLYCVTCDYFVVDWEDGSFKHIVETMNEPTFKPGYLTPLTSGMEKINNLEFHGIGYQRVIRPKEGIENYARIS